MRSSGPPGKKIRRNSAAEPQKRPPIQHVPSEALSGSQTGMRLNNYFYTFYKHKCLLIYANFLLALFRDGHQSPDLFNVSQVVELVLEAVLLLAVGDLHRSQSVMVYLSITCTRMPYTIRKCLFIHTIYKFTFFEVAEDLDWPAAHVRAVRVHQVEVGDGSAKIAQFVTSQWHLIEKQTYCEFINN